MTEPVEHNPYKVLVEELQHDEFVNVVVLVEQHMGQAVAKRVFDKLLGSGPGVAAAPMEPGIVAGYDFSKAEAKVAASVAAPVSITGDVVKPTVIPTGSYPGVAPMPWGDFQMKHPYVTLQDLAKIRDTLGVPGNPHGNLVPWIKAVRELGVGKVLGSDMPAHASDIGLKDAKRFVDWLMANKEFLMVLGTGWTATSYKVGDVVTGKLSSTLPNMSNIPKAPTTPQDIPKPPNDDHLDSLVSLKALMPKTASDEYLAQLAKNMALPKNMLQVTGEHLPYSSSVKFDFDKAKIIEEAPKKKKATKKPIVVDLETQGLVPHISQIGVPYLQDKKMVGAVVKWKDQIFKVHADGTMHLDTGTDLSKIQMKTYDEIVKDITDVIGSHHQDGIQEEVYKTMQEQLIYGLPVGKTTMITGGQKFGKTILAQQALDEALKSGKKVKVVGLESSADDVKAKLMAHWDVESKQQPQQITLTGSFPKVQPGETVHLELTSPVAKGTIVYMSKGHKLIAINDKGDFNLLEGAPEDPVGNPTEAAEQKGMDDSVPNSIAWLFKQYPSITWGKIKAIYDELGEPLLMDGSMIHANNYTLWTNRIRHLVEDYAGNPMIPYASACAVVNWMVDTKFWQQPLNLL